MILNLDKNFNPYNDIYGITDFNFPGGEVHVKLQAVTEYHVCITTRIRTSDDVMKLLLTVDALRRYGVKSVSLVMPYIPYARQDRVMVKGEPLSIKVFADLINSQNFTSVTVFDPHSEVAPALINNCIVLDNHNFVAEVIAGQMIQNYKIISPDAGAYKKIFKLCQFIGYNDDIVLCNKIRDVSNGQIKSITVSTDDLKGMDCIIVDDICDGGGTFILLAEELKKRNAGKIYLIVSHGIFSKGMDVFTNIDHVFTTNSFNDQSEHNKLTQIKLTNGLLS